MKAKNVNRKKNARGVASNTNKTEDRLRKIIDAIEKLPIESRDQLEQFINSTGRKALSLKEASQIIGVSVDTVRRAIKAGSLKAFQLNRSGGIYRISTEEIDRFIRGDRSHV